MAFFQSPVDVANKMAPAFAIEMNGIPLDIGITQFVKRLEFESSDGLADVAKLTVSNPDFILTDRNVFQPLNRMTFRMGYGTRLSHVGSALIKSVTPRFPRNEMPTIEVVGLGKDMVLMDHAPEKAKPSQKSRDKKNTKKTSGRKFVDVLWSDVVGERASDYSAPDGGFETDIDPTKGGQHTFIQKAGMTDYDLIKSLSNISGFIFWVDFDDDAKKWTLHFRDPDKMNDQEKQYTFDYNDGDFSSLLDFEPTELIKGSNTKITVQTYHELTGKLMETTVEDEPLAGDANAVFVGDVSEKVTAPTAGAPVRLFFQDYSFDVFAAKRFRTEQEVREWAASWFKRHKRDFVTARGTLIGIEDLRAREIHAIKGVGAAYSGNWYFSTVRHIFDASSGYTIDFNARKVI